MQLTLNIDITSNKAQAFIDFIRTLDFIKISDKTNTQTLSEEQIKIISKRRAKHIAGESKSYKWNDIKSELKK